MIQEVMLTSMATVAIAFALGALSGSHRFMKLLLYYGVVLAVASAFSIYSSYPNGHSALPYLAGSDGEGYYNDALNLVRYGIENYKGIVRINYSGYQIYLSAWFKIFGPSVGIALVANHLLLMLSIYCLFRATELLTGARNAALLACVLLMLTSSHAFNSLVLLKEPAINLAFGLMLWSVAIALRQTNRGLKAALLFVAALVIVVMVRATLLLFVLVLLSSLLTLFIRRRAWVAVALALVWILILPYADSFSNKTLDVNQYTQTMLHNMVLVDKLQSGEVATEGVVGRVLGVYLELPILLRILLFAVPVALQMLLPFDVWSTGFLSDHFSLFFSRNANLVWLLFILPWTLFTVVHVRKLKNPALSSLLLAGVGYYIIIAIIYGGAIPRYASPAMYFIYPAAGFWWWRLREDSNIRRRVYSFFRRYYATGCMAMVAYLMINWVQAN